ADMPPLTLAAADPMNLVGVVVPGERTPSIAGNTVTLPLPQAVPEPAILEMPDPGAVRFEAPELEGGALA
ncbi:MAG: hypothetical protein WA399_04105, partial [Acidobacteriaceae bacterium]